MGWGYRMDQILMSWDSTIFAKVFLTLKMVRREAGLCAQHSDISFNMALKHCGDELWSAPQQTSYLCISSWTTRKTVTKPLLVYCHLLVSYWMLSLTSSLFHLLDTVGRNPLTHTTCSISSYDGSDGTISWYGSWYSSTIPGKHQIMNYWLF